jgi:hypothetical protein
MSNFDIFQTATATMEKVTTDGFGDETVASSFSVEIDPVLGKKQTYTKEQEQVTGLSTVISPNSNIDLSHDRWNLVYDGRTYQIEELEPFYKIGTNDISHYQVIIR